MCHLVSHHSSIKSQLATGWVLVLLLGVSCHARQQPAGPAESPPPSAPLAEAPPPAVAAGAEPPASPEEPATAAPPSGKRAPCTSDQACNDDESVSALWGTCTPLGVCECKPGFELNPRGRCQNPVQ
jgi:hypothetical protein